MIINSIDLQIIIASLRFAAGNFEIQSKQMIGDRLLSGRLLAFSKQCGELSNRLEAGIPKIDAAQIQKIVEGQIIAG